ncbi:MAG: PAS domain-containing protein [Alphaproteobacteria bacterium]|nr:PAS domain-containing protein [Alphaproteobacteria bacterium]
MTATSPAPNKTRPREGAVGLYYLLVAFTVTIIAAGLWMFHSMDVAYGDIITESGEWRTYLDEAAVLEDDLLRAHSQALRGFAQSASQGWYDEFKDQLGRFQVRAARLKNALEAESGEQWRPRFSETLPAMHRSLSEANIAVERIGGITRTLFLSLQSGSDNRAHQLISALTADMRLAISKLREMSSHMREVQARLWSSHAQQLGDTRRAELALGAALVAIMLSLALFGRALRAHFSRSAAVLEMARRDEATAAARFKDFAEIASDWLWETDANGVLSYVSDSSSPDGLNPRVLIGVRVIEGISDVEAGRAAIEKLDHLTQMRRPFEGLLLPFKSGSGTVAWVSTSATPQFDKDGGFVGYRGAARTVTRLIEAQIALAANQERYESLSNSIDGVVYRLLLGNPWKVEYLSPNTERFFGVAPQQLLDLPAKEILWWAVHPEDRKRHESVLIKAIEGRTSYEVEFRMKSPFGGYRFMLERGRVVESGTGGAPVLDSLIVDITEQVAAREALQRSEARFSSMASNFDGAMFRVSLNYPTVTEYVSPGIKELTGFDAGSLIDQPSISLMLMHVDDQAHYFATVSAALMARELYECEYRITLADGTVKWLLERGRASTHTQDGTPTLVDGFIVDVTKRKKLEQAVVDRDNRMQALALNLKGSIYRCRVSPRELVSHLGERPPTFESISTDDLPGYASTIADACREMRPYEVEYRIVDTDGAERWMSERGVPSQPDESGSAQYIDGLILDVTQQKRLREELERHAKLVSDLAENLDGAMFRVCMGDGGRVAFVSSGIKKVIGIDAGRIVGRALDLSSFMFPEEISERARVVSKAVRERGHYESRHRARFPDGSVRWVLERGRVTEYDANGAPSVLDGVVFDVTEQHRLHGELEQREERLTSLASNIDGVLFRARLGKPTLMEYYSPGIKKQVGIGAAELIGKPSIGWRLTHNDDRERYESALKSALRQKSQYEVEFRIILPNGETRWLLERGRATAYDAEGKPLILEGMSLDITERKEVEAALADARDAAEAASRAKSAFLAMMSHEIRTPMNGVLGMTGVLMDTPLSVEQRRAASTIRESAESLLGIINDVLDFSKLEAEAMEFERVGFDVYALLTYTKEIVAPRANGKAIDLGVQIDGEVPQYVCGDPGRIRQVVLNLLGNAVKFTERGLVTLKVSAQTASEGDVRLRVSVVDTGIGVPADRIDRLFQSFSQTDASMSRRFGGTGLGLAISKKLTERMGGTIGVESVPGSGSTFWFELPLAVSSAAEVENSALRVDATRLDAALDAISALGRPLRLLVAEDNATNQLVAKSVLAKFSITPDFVGNGLEAIDAVRRRPYDIVLMDVHMPEMDGLEATRAIRALTGPESRLPIVALTANAFAHDVEACRSAGMNAHVGKPFRTEELLVALGDALHGGSRFEAAASPVVTDASEGAVLDWNTIENFRADSGEEMLRLLIDTYLADASEKLDQLARLAGDSSATAEATRLAHSLKSASAMAGAVALSKLAAAVERRMSGGEAKLDALEAQEMARAFQLYREALNSRGLVAA